MTSIADTARHTAWRGRLVWVALALSLALNVCFLGGLFWVKMHQPLPPPLRVQHLLRPLDLTPDQQRSLDQFLLTLRLRGRFMRENDQAMTGELWSEVAKPNPDATVVAKLTTEINENRLGFQHEASTALGGFLKSLTPDQRAQLAGIAKAPPDEMTRRLFDFILPQ